MHLQLRLGRQLEQRDVELLALGHRFACGHHLGEPAVERALLFMVHGPQGQRAQELLVHVDVERGLVCVGTRCVAVAQVYRNALLAPAKQIGRQEEVHADQVGRIAGHIERLGLGQFAKFHGPVAGQPVGGVVGLAGLQLGDLGDACERTRQCRGANRQCLGRHGQLGVVAPHDQQQFAIAVGRVADHGHGGAGDFGQRQACGRLRPARHHHHGVATRRQLTNEGRELRATETRQRAKPRRHRARRLQGACIGRGIEHDGEFQRPHVPAVKEGLGQQRQVVGLRHRGHRQLQHAVVADVGPQAGVQRVFALHGVVADELQVQPVELGDEARRDGDLALQVLTGLLGGHRNRGRHLLVHQHLDVRQVGEQRRRIRVIELELGANHHLIVAHAEGHAAGAIHPPQLQREQRAQLFEAGPVDTHARLGRWHGCRGRCGQRCGGGCQLRNGRCSPRQRQGEHGGQHALAWQPRCRTSCGNHGEGEVLENRERLRACCARSSGA